MKLFSLFSLSAMASETGISRSRRDVDFSFSGEESADFFSQFLAEITDGTTDEIDQLIFNLSGGEESRFISEVESRKFRQLKIVVLWLQQEQKFGRYCYYGCYCLPEGSHNIASGGYGKPRDSIDRTCKDFKQCYHCLKAEYDGERDCVGEDIGYKFDLLTNADGSKDVICTNKPGSCRYNVCQCDLALAKGLAKYEQTWDEQYHSVKGGFDREAVCTHQGGGNYNPVMGCCGDKSTFPFNEMVRANQCCDGPFAKPAGECY
ncbi:unnamed protein product [Oikopleura dioica]|uniref:Phospholipase A2-like central domain-containing protein n=1 Tax=Oikopleura dioica TaxID=34765 RepID=E4XHK9_OIKDI|nr:unnamed protein product [Oikopleura dioica]CBY35448.1 unnamed protein product [Oikopleura dioica]CBY37061.1 unnamed protein product [Oikopleura dioica]